MDSASKQKLSLKYFGLGLTIPCLLRVVTAIGDLSCDEGAELGRREHAMDEPDCIALSLIILPSKGVIAIGSFELLQLVGAVCGDCVDDGLVVL